MWLVSDLWELRWRLLQVIFSTAFLRWKFISHYMVSVIYTTWRETIQLTQRKIICSFYTASFLCVRWWHGICTAKTAKVAIFTRLHDRCILSHKKKTHCILEGKKLKRKYWRDHWIKHSRGRYEALMIASLHKVPAPAVRAAVKTELSYQNDAIILWAFSSQLPKIKSMLKLLWPLLVFNSRVLGLILDLQSGKT